MEELRLQKKDTTANNELRSGSPPPLFNGVESAAAAVQQFSRNVLASNHRRRVQGVACVTQVRRGPKRSNYNRWCSDYVNTSHRASAVPFGARLSIIKL